MAAEYASRVSEEYCQPSGRTEAQVIPLLSASDPKENTSQLGLMSPALEGAGSPTTGGPAVGMPPASFYTDMSRLVESLIKSHTIYAHRGYRKLLFFSGHAPKAPPVMLLRQVTQAQHQMQQALMYVMEAKAKI